LVGIRTRRPRRATARRSLRADPQASIVAVFAVASFASLTGLLYLEGALAIRGEPIPEERIIGEASEFYIWRLVDTVPFLDIPANLHWEKPLEFEDRVGGLLLVLFTGIVVLPLIQAVRLIATGYQQPYERAVLNALRRSLPGWKVHRTRREWDYDLAVVAKEVRILVDVMQGVWTEDAALRRLTTLLREHKGARFVDLLTVSGYVLVVDVVGERARDRIVEEFAESEFPVRLAVWRSDEPEIHLAQVVKLLGEEIERNLKQQGASQPR
jgi:hypothetical protein